MFDMQKIGKKIVSLRREKNMTQTELADRLNVSFQAVSNWERGQSMPDISKLPELAEIFEISIDELLGVKSKFVESVADGKMEEYLDSEEVSTDEISEAMPILTPDQVETVMEKTEAADFDKFSEFLPYMSEDDVAEVAMEVAKTGKDVEEFLPYMSEDDVAEIAMEALKAGKGVEKFLPYMDEDDVAALANEALKSDKFTQDFLSYMDEDDVGALAMEAVKHGHPVEVFLSYMCEDDVGALAVEAVKHGHSMEVFLSYMCDDDIAKLAEQALQLGKDADLSFLHGRGRRRKSCDESYGNGTAHGKIFAIYGRRRHRQNAESVYEETKQIIPSQRDIQGASPLDECRAESCRSLRQSLNLIMKKPPTVSEAFLLDLNVVFPVIVDFAVLTGVGLEDLTDLKEVFHGVSFENENEFGHVGGSTNKTPTVFKLNTCAVDITNLAGVSFFHFGCDLINDTVFYGVAAMCFDFRGANIVREGFDDFRNGFFAVGKVFHEFCRYENSIVKAIPVIAGNKDVTTAFTCEFCVELMELGFDVGVTGLPHNGVTFVSNDNVFKCFGAFYVVDNGGTGFLFEELFCEKCKNDITPNVLAFFVDNTDAVAVAVKGKTDVCMDIGVADHLTQTLSAGELGGVGEVVGERSIRIAVEMEGHAAEALEYFINEKTCTAVCCVECNTDLLRAHFDAGNDRFDVSITNVHFLVSTHFFVAGFDIEKCCHFDDVVGFECFGIAVCKFEAGPTIGVVARGDHNGAFTFEVILREVGKRRERKTDKEYVDAFFTECFDRCFRKRGRTFTAVITDNGTRDVSSLEILCVSFYDLMHAFGVELILGNFATNIIFTKHAAKAERVLGIMNHNGFVPF